MSSESSNALDRLRAIAFEGADERHDNENHRFGSGCCFRGAFIDAGLAAVLPALADEISQNPDLFRPEGSAVAGWLRSLAASGDEPKL